jgi:hypothetical protein
MTAILPIGLLTPFCGFVQLPGEMSTSWARIVIGMVSIGIARRLSPTQTACEATRESGVE